MKCSLIQFCISAYDLKILLFILQSAPRPLPFNPDDFIASLESSGPHLTSSVKGNWEGLYRRFFRSANFSGWYNTRYQSMAKKLKVLQLEALSHIVSAQLSVDEPSSYGRPLIFLNDCYRTYRNG